MYYVYQAISVRLDEGEGFKPDCCVLCVNHVTETVVIIISDYHEIHVFFFL